MEKKQISAIVSIILSAVIALAALWGYNIVVVQPLAEQVALNSLAEVGESTGHSVAGGESRAVGDTNFTNVVATGDLTAGGSLGVAGATALNGSVVIGDGGDTVAINSSDWDISSAGALTGIGAITSDGVATIRNNATITGSLSLADALETGPALAIQTDRIVLKADGTAEFLQGAVTIDALGNFNVDGGYQVDGLQVVGSRGAAIPTPTGGGTVDAEARTAIGSILSAMRTHGLIAP